MRKPLLLLSLSIAALAITPVLLPQATASAGTPLAKLPAASPKSLVSGAYILVINPKKIGNQPLKATRAGALPVIVKTDGKTVIMSGKYGPSMTGTINNGVLTLSHTPGVSFSMVGNTFNGYAASGGFQNGTGSFAGTWGLVTFSSGGISFMGAQNGAGAQWGGILNQKKQGFYQPSGSNSAWGYDGPGLDLTGGTNAFHLPVGSGASGDTSKGGKSSGFDIWHPIDSLASSLDISSGDSSGSSSGGKSSSGGSSGGGSSSGSGSTKDHIADFKGSSSSSSSSSGSSSDNDHWYCDLCCCGSGDSSSSSSSGSASGGTSAGGFDAGDWEPLGGDTSPGQKPKTGNGQDTGGSNSRTSLGNTSAGGFKNPLGGGDPSDLYKPGPGDILNTNKLFNGASDPPRGANFGR